MLLHLHHIPREMVEVASVSLLVYNKDPDCTAFIILTVISNEKKNKKTQRASRNIHLYVLLQSSDNTAIVISRWSNVEDHLFHCFDAFQIFHCFVAFSFQLHSRELYEGVKHKVLYKGLPEIIINILY